MVSLVFNLIVNWLGAMAFHLFRIITLRPYFKGIADTQFSLVSFGAVFVLGALSRYATKGHQSGEAFARILLFDIAVLGLVALRPGQSKALFCVLLGASAVMDFMFSTIHLLGFEMSSNSLSISLAQAFLIWMCLKRFKAEPDQVKSKGYKQRR